MLLKIVQCCDLIFYKPLASHLIYHCKNFQKISSTFNRFSNNFIKRIPLARIKYISYLCWELLMYNQSSELLAREMNFQLYFSLFLYFFHTLHYLRSRHLHFTDLDTWPLMTSGRRQVVMGKVFLCVNCQIEIFSWVSFTQQLAWFNSHLWDVYFSPKLRTNTIIFLGILEYCT